MLRRQQHPGRALSGTRATAPLRRPGAVASHPVAPHGAHPNHPLTRSDENARLYDYERRVKSAFDAIVPTLKRVSALQHEEGFEQRAQAIVDEYERSLALVLDEPDLVERETDSASP